MTVSRGCYIPEKPDRRDSRLVVFSALDCCHRADCLVLRRLPFPFARTRGSAWNGVNGEISLISAVSSRLVPWIVYPESRSRISWLANLYHDKLRFAVLALNRLSKSFQALVCRVLEASSYSGFAFFSFVSPLFLSSPLVSSPFPLSLFISLSSLPSFLLSVALCPCQYLPRNIRVSITQGAY